MYIKTFPTFLPFFECAFCSLCANTSPRIWSRRKSWPMSKSFLSRQSNTYKKLFLVLMYLLELPSTFHNISCWLFHRGCMLIHSLNPSGNNSVADGLGFAQCFTIEFQMSASKVKLIFTFGLKLPHSKFACQINGEKY